MNMNNPLENLRQLTEAVRMAGADIAPTYIEYVQLAFAIANDCGEAGRNDFLSLCSLSSKYDKKNAHFAALPKHPAYVPVPGGY